VLADTCPLLNPVGAAADRFFGVTHSHVVSNRGQPILNCKL
jgi:hypothetical protein